MTGISSSQGEPASKEAALLHERWHRLANTHTTVGGGCSCGAAGVVVALSDFEQDIVDFIWADAEQLERPDVLSFLATHGREGDRWSIPKLLMWTTNSTAGSKGDVEPFILERLSTTLNSFEKLHAGH